jgi:hypothetical protein
MGDASRNLLNTFAFSNLARADGLRSLPRSDMMSCSQRASPRLPTKPFIFIDQSHPPMQNDSLGSRIAAPCGPPWPAGAPTLAYLPIERFTPGPSNPRQSVFHPDPDKEFDP